MGREEESLDCYRVKMPGNELAIAAHACNPSTLGGQGRRVVEFELSLGYRETWRDPVSKFKKGRGFSSVPRSCVHSSTTKTK